jgi:hypothetical protein
MTNLFPIRKGTTWNWELRFWNDADKTSPKDVSGHTFNCLFKDKAGATKITLNNAAFAAGASSNSRIVTRTDVQTAAYTAEELKYELMVTLPSGSIELWQEGHLNIEA